VTRGKIHTQIYPVEVTGMLPPYPPLLKLMNHFGIRALDDIFAWVGLNPYPAEDATGVYAVPYPVGRRPDTRMGLGFIETADGKGFSLSCAECHSANLFGKTVLGMTNRFPRANEVFLAAIHGVPLISDSMLRGAHATEGEVRMFERMKENLKSVAAKKPAVFGLDTSLAQVALSLAKRNLDAYATRNDEIAAHPRPDPLDTAVADSKPAVWWNLKFKNRWLSDGSVVSGSPILTNILWNEIGRGGGT
jgi:hypothetical protein